MEEGIRDEHFNSHQRRHSASQSLLSVCIPFICGSNLKRRRPAPPLAEIIRWNSPRQRPTLPPATLRKIIHIDMDCFYAAIEERENPALRGKPVGVSGSDRRSVLTTANYEARKFGCRSAMPVFKALALCPHLVLVPVQFDLYRAVSSRIRLSSQQFAPLRRLANSVSRASSPSFSKPNKNHYFWA